MPGKSSSGAAERVNVRVSLFFISFHARALEPDAHGTRSGIHIPLFVGWVIFTLISVCIRVHWAIEAWTNTYIRGMSKSHDTTARHAVNVIRCIKPLNSADKQRINSGRRLPQYQRNYYTKFIQTRRLTPNNTIF